MKVYFLQRKDATNNLETNVVRIWKNRVWGEPTTGRFEVQKRYRKIRGLVFYPYEYNDEKMVGRKKCIILRYDGRSLHLDGQRTDKSSPIAGTDMYGIQGKISHKSEYTLRKVSLEEVNEVMAGREDIGDKRKAILAGILMTDEKNK